MPNNEINVPRLLKKSNLAFLALYSLSAFIFFCVAYGILILDFSFLGVA